MQVSVIILLALSTANAFVTPIDIRTIQSNVALPDPRMMNQMGTQTVQVAHNETENPAKTLSHIFKRRRDLVALESRGHEFNALHNNFAASAYSSMKVENYIIH